MDSPNNERVGDRILSTGPIRSPTSVKSVHACINNILLDSEVLVFFAIATLCTSSCVCLAAVIHWGISRAFRTAQKGLDSAYQHKLPTWSEEDLVSDLLKEHTTC